MKANVCPFLFGLVLAILAANDAYATHLRAAEIQVKRLSCNTLTYEIKVIVYLDARSMTLFGGSSYPDGYVSFGDNSQVLIPATVGTPRPDLGPDMATASFTTVHSYAVPGIYKINYYERDRSAGVLNMSNSDDTPYNSSITINTATVAGCNQFPLLTIPPVDKSCSGVAFFHNPGAYDPDGDSLSYALTVPEKNVDVDVDGYLPVDDHRFYVNFNLANEFHNGPATFSINPLTGLITWNAPGLQGQYNIAFEIIEWRKIAATGELIRLSTTVRDMQIIVYECDNVRPDIRIPNDTCIVAGAKLNATITGTDPDYDSIKIESFSEIFNLPTPAKSASLSPADARFMASFPPYPTRDFSWDTECLHVREQPYLVVFKVSDKSERGTLTTFKTWKIKVIAPPPVWKLAQLQVGNRSADLEWEDYACNNATAIQIWRKVDQIDYAPGICDSGIPVFLGYKLIATLDPSVRKFNDTNNGKGLSPGAKYCYRMVATFPLPAGGKSYVSTEACVGPILIDAPVITHVSVERTDSIDGTIRVRWVSPLAISHEQFPKPYAYEVYRAEGLKDSLGVAIKVSDRITDTTFLDTQIRTSKTMYNYRIVIYAKTNDHPEFMAIDTSAEASSVWLAAEPGPKRITLRWDAIVPWSNVIQSSPWHRIYRSSQASSDMVLIDSINVVTTGFTYTDIGQFQHTPLDDNTGYSYRIMTRGGYGNPIIPIQQNVSQSVFLYPENKTLPCPPLIAVALTNCDQFLQRENCEGLEYENEISWQPNTAMGCRSDIVSYKLFSSAAVDGEYEPLLLNTPNRLFVDTGLPSFARCYRVSAVDAQGHESELSEPSCNDNCPYFSLPNIFTPNGDGCNDLLHSYRPADEAPCSDGISSSCPKFVEHISFKVYNRWGNSIYDFESENGGSLDIDWDGRDSNGTLLDPAVYYYHAEVTFTTIDPTKKKKDIHGWIQLNR